jgi:hypothetical protein
MPSPAKPSPKLFLCSTSISPHKCPTVDKLGGQLKNIFKTAGAPHNTALEWGNSGHRFYPDKMWPFIGKALAKKK